MFSSPEPPRITNPLRNTTEKPGDPTMAHVPVTSVRIPVVIPGSGRRRQSSPQISTSPRRRPVVFAIVLSGCVVMLIAAALFVVPLDNGQEQVNGLQVFGNWISSGQFGALNPSQHVDPPTPTPALLTNDGYCGGTNLWGTCATAITASGVMGTGHMHHPILGAVITQYFGHMEYQMWCGCWRPHTGIDLAAAFGTAIMAADSGQVIWTGWDVSGLGWAVKVNHGRYIGTVYGHMERFIVKVGQNVTRGQVIGYEGSTGASTGPHVHFMVLYNNIWVNPLNYVQLP
jgi:murein DD-endopeptidase MepM/ murein hydrolase activator NlpD